MLELVIKTLSRNCDPDVTSKIKAPLQEARRPNSGLFSRVRVSWLSKGESSSTFGVSNGVDRSVDDPDPGREMILGSRTLGTQSTSSAPWRPTFRLNQSTIAIILHCGDPKSLCQLHTRPCCLLLILLLLIAADSVKNLIFWSSRSKKWVLPLREASARQQVDEVDEVHTEHCFIG